MRSQKEACSLLATVYENYVKSDNKNPIETMNTIFKSLGSLAEAIFSCRTTTPHKKRTSDWNEYVKRAQTEYELAEAFWDLSDRLPHSPLAQNLAPAKAYRRLCIRKIKQNIQLSVARAKADHTRKHEKSLSLIHI